VVGHDDDQRRQQREGQQFDLATASARREQRTHSARAAELGAGTGGEAVEPADPGAGINSISLTPCQRAAATFSAPAANHYSGWAARRQNRAAKAQWRMATRSRPDAAR
jgi:hypothetical protein